MGSICSLFGAFSAHLLNINLNLLTWVSEIIGKSNWGNLTLTRPSAIFFILYYAVFIIFRFIYSVVRREKTWYELTNLEKKELKLVRIVEEKKRYYKKIIIVFILIMIIVSAFIKIIPVDLKISFIDVGQGDASLIQTSYHKTILIDGGGNLDKEAFDVGENTLVPYMLNQKIKIIDYLIISHFDSDHVRRAFNSYGKIEGKKCSNCKASAK